MSFFTLPFVPSLAFSFLPIEIITPHACRLHSRHCQPNRLLNALRCTYFYFWRFRSGNNRSVAHKSHRSMSFADSAKTLTDYCDQIAWYESLRFCNWISRIAVIVDWYKMHIALASNGILLYRSQIAQQPKWHRITQKRWGQFSHRRTLMQIAIIQLSQVATQINVTRLPRWPDFRDSEKMEYYCVVSDNSRMCCILHETSQWCSANRCCSGNFDKSAMDDGHRLSHNTFDTWTRPFGSWTTFRSLSNLTSSAQNQHKLLSGKRREWVFVWKCLSPFRNDVEMYFCCRRYWREYLRENSFWVDSIFGLFVCYFATRKKVGSNDIDFVRNSSNEESRMILREWHIWLKTNFRISEIHPKQKTRPSHAKYIIEVQRSK